MPCILHGGDGDNLAIDEDKGLFHCFTCDKAGDVITLYALMEGISNSEAAKRLAQEYRVEGVQWTPRRVFDEMKSWQPSGPLPEVQLPSSKVLNGYRRFSKYAISHFDLRLVDTGVLIPIRDIDGRVVGYTIRQINILPKYLNNTNLKKSQVVYGLYENKHEIQEARQVIVCEGPFSAIRVWDQGYSNVVATLGAPMSPAQAHLLAPFVSKVRVLYDGDEKGRESAKKIQENYSALFNVEIITLPDGKDPDNVGLLGKYLQQ